MDFRGKKYERGSNWSDPEVVELLQLWADESVQVELESCLRNQHVFNRIAEVLREKGIHRTGDQCREKIKKMKLEYRRIKDNSKTLRGGRTWKFFEVMDRVLTSRPAISYSAMGGAVIAQQVLQTGSGVDTVSFHSHHHLPHHQLPSHHHPFAGPPHPFSSHSQLPTSELMEIKCEEVESDDQCLSPEPPASMNYQQGSAEDPDADNSRGLTSRSQESPGSRVDAPAETSISPSATVLDTPVADKDAIYNEQNMGSSSSVAQNREPRPSFSSFYRLRKKRKLQRLKDPLDDIFHKFLASQRAMEERFLQLEERHMQRDLELEERRMQLEQRRVEMEREHELRMFTVFAQMVSSLRADSSPDFGLVHGLQMADRWGEDSKLMKGKASARPPSNPSPDPDNSPERISPYLSKRGNRISNFYNIMNEGYIAYVADKYDEDKNPNGIVNLGTSENKLCFDLLSKRLTQSDMHQIDPPLLQYPDWRGHPFIREEFARFFTYYCKAPAPLKPENVIVINGGGSLFCSLAAVLCDPGEFSENQMNMTGSDTRPFHLTVERLEKSLQDAKMEDVRVRALILMNPHNPLADVYSPTEMKDFLEFAKRHELHVIVDEVYMLSVFEETAQYHSVLSFDRLPDPQRTHVMWALSKDFAASGIRVGSLYTENQDVLSAVAQLAFLHGVPGPTQHKVAQLLRDRVELAADSMKEHCDELQEGNFPDMDRLKEISSVKKTTFKVIFLWQMQTRCIRVSREMASESKKKNRKCKSLHQADEEKRHLNDWINQTFLQTNRARLKAAHKYVTDELKELGIPFLNRHAAFFVWADFRRYLKTLSFEEELLLWRRFVNNKVLIICGKAFECCEPGWFRIIFSDKTYRLQLGMQRLQKVLKEVEQEMQSEDKLLLSQLDAECKADIVEETVLHPSSQEKAPGLDGLIGLLKRQMQSSDWLQKHTVEQFAQDNPEVFEVFSRLAGK
ncbi:1-aminocyclopropane-1-carboxylate synthase-like protein 1 [Protopterus annectens]|uniref:1-aminocyclopropane-1-carboxylate synthase-like protein 1 n=1 Tax=Protopterus annectens TaxID=7888 RepID=UPI001CFB372D|nr:1-aminocyclopropane-1-carboxylate synthase-like protein 1 [Protopterus annectens]